MQLQARPTPTERKPVTDRTNSRSTGWKFLVLGVPFTGNHHNRVQKHRQVAVKENWNAKTEVKFKGSTVENFTGAVWLPLSLLCDKGVVAWMRGKSAGRCHFDFLK